MKKRNPWTVAAGAAIVLLGASMALYPFATDVRYAAAQWAMGFSLDGVAQASTGGITLPEKAVARIEIPAIDLQAYVVEGTDDPALAQGPGHYPETPLPGEAGNVGIAGHRTMHGHVFHDLHLLQVGDEILTGTAATTAAYRVVETMVVDPSRVDVVSQDGPDRLTLTTCHPIGSAAQRLVVVAELVQ
jgi:sortase A